MTLTNGMAKEYTEETNYDGSVTYRFTLRSTARWSDGEKVTADTSSMPGRDLPTPRRIRRTTR